MEPPSALMIKRGAAVKQTLRVTVEAGSHVNSDKPRNEFLIPFRLEWEPGVVTASAVHYPAAEEIQVGPDKLTVYTGSFPVITDFKAAPNATAGMFEVKGKLHFQACNNEMCFRPATLPVVLAVTVQ